jgi:hypothetical protein
MTGRAPGRGQSCGSDLATEICMLLSACWQHTVRTTCSGKAASPALVIPDQNESCLVCDCSHAQEARVAILVSCAHNQLQQDRGTSSTWLREGYGVVCESANLRSGSDRQGTQTASGSTFTHLVYECTYYCVMKPAAQ